LKILGLWKAVTRPVRCAKRDLTMRTRIFVYLTSTLLFVLGGALPAQQQPVQEQVPRVLVVPIQSAIDSSTVLLTRRALQEAKERGISRVILRLDTPGGLVTAMQEVKGIIRAMDEFNITPLAFVENRALSAGAYLAMACSEIYMRPGTEIGAGTPIEMTPLGPRDIQNRDVRRKMISDLKAEARSALELRGNVRPQTLLIAEGIVDPDMEIFEVSYRDPSEVVVRELVDATKLESLRKQAGVRFIGEPRQLDTPLTLTAQEAQRFGLCRGIVDSLRALVEDDLNLSWSQVASLKPTWADNLALFLNNYRPVFFVLGFVLLLIEMKTPGFALPGILGILMLALAFWASAVAGLAEWWEIILFFLGIGLIGVEIFVMPGTLIFGILGFLCMVAGLILSQQPFFKPEGPTDRDLMAQNLLNFMYMLITTLTVVFLFYKVMHRIPILNRAIQRPPELARATGAATAFKEDVRGKSQLIGLVGKAATALRPAGIMEVGGERYDVVTEGAFVEPGARVKVIHVEGNRVVVEAMPQESGEVGVGVLILLLALGLALLVCEVFFVSMGILGGLSAVSLITAVFLTFTDYGQFWGFVMLFTVAIAAPLVVHYAFKLLPHTSFGQKMYLSGPDPSQVSGSGADPTIRELLHKRGVAISDLRPAGFATIEGRRVDVVTRGELLDKDTPLKVIQVEGNRVVVARNADSTDSHKEA